MTYILIILYTVSRQGGVAGVEFNSLRECEEAKTIIAEHYTGYPRGLIREENMLCVPKGYGDL